MTPSEADLIIERRRERRRLAIWRTAAIMIAAVTAAIWFRSDEAPARDYIARYEVFGVIYDDPGRDDLLAQIEMDKRARAVMLRIESPGGTTVGAEALYDSIRRIAAKKPVVAVMGEAATSGAYIAAIATDHLVARGNTITGSIGVVAQYTDYGELMETLGVTVEEIRSGELKAQPSPYRAMTPQTRALEEALVADSYDWFKGLVAERRNINEGQLSGVADGRVLSGRQALKAGLIDQIGGEIEALAWLESEGDLPKGLPIHDMALPSKQTGAWDVIEFFMSKLGVDGARSLARAPDQGLRLYSIRR